MSERTAPAPEYDDVDLRGLCNIDGDWGGTAWGHVINGLLDRIDAAGALVERWEQEAAERGPDDQLNTTGVTNMLRRALALPTEKEYDRV